MKRIFILTLFAVLLHIGAYAQLGKQMAKYHEKDGITVTQLDQSVYGLYQNNNLTPEAAAMLRKLDEVNILDIDLNTCQPSLSEKISNQFRSLLSDNGKYRLVKSHQNAGNKQLIYTAGMDMDSTLNQLMGGMFGSGSPLGGSGFAQSTEEIIQHMDNNGNIVSNSVQITEENGKTKLKIDSKNSDITYIIDGVQAPKENVQMPDRIRNVNLIPSREDIKKSYLFVTSENPLGTFSSFKDGILTFQYDNQEYRYNLDKASAPLLVIDGRQSSTFDLDPSTILQIRPITQIEKEVGYYPDAQVIINTK